MKKLPLDKSGLPVVVRLELLVGLLQDILFPARKLIDQLKVRSNAGLQTRNELGFLSETAGSIWEKLGTCIEEIQELRSLITDDGLNRKK